MLKTFEPLLFFHMTFLTGNLEILLKYLLITSYYFFPAPRWIVFGYEVCFDKARMKALVEHAR